MRGARALVVYGALLLPAAAPAQELHGELFAGQFAHAPFGAFAAEAGLGAALTHSGDAHRLRLAAGRTLEAGGPLWGALTLRARPELGSALHWETEASAFTFAGGPETGSGHGVLGRAGPAATLRTGMLTLEAAALMGMNTMRWEREVWTRSAPELRGRLRAAPGDALVLGATARAVLAAEGPHSFAGAEAVWGAERVGAWASAGRWFGKGSEADLGAGAWLRATGGTELHLAYRVAAPDPLLLDPARRGWTLSLSHPVGPRPAPPHVPLVHGKGTVTFRIGASEAPGTPYLLGDFTGWQPMPMRLEGGAWTAEVRVGSGVHLFAFRTADGRVFLPRSVQARRPDGMGGENGVLIVP